MAEEIAKAADARDYFLSSCPQMLEEKSSFHILCTKTIYIFGQPVKFSTKSQLLQTLDIKSQRKKAFLKK